MILTPNNEYCVVLDTCVLVPMPLCDTLLRAAEEPSFFRIAWSGEILEEVRRTLNGPKFNYSAQQAERRIASMQAAFPEAFHSIPPGLIDGMMGRPTRTTGTFWRLPTTPMRTPSSPTTCATFPQRR